jgi:hypothetical protein
MQVPKSKTVEVLQAFYVYNHVDAPVSSSEDPVLQFQGLGFVSTAPTEDVPASALPSFTGVQVSFVTDSDIGVFINSRSLCSNAKDVADGNAQEKDQLLLQGRNTQRAVSDFRYSHTVPFLADTADKLSETQKSVPTTGVYYLALSNCGGHINGTLRGTVTVKNSFGYLPGDEYYKLPFFRMAHPLLSCRGISLAGAMCALVPGACANPSLDLRDRDLGPP